MNTARSHSVHLDFPSHILSSPFAVSVHTLQSPIYTHSCPSPVHNHGQTPLSLTIPLHISFPRPSQSQSTLYNHQSTHIPVPLLFTITARHPFHSPFPFTYPFLALRSLSPHSTITNLHIFLSLSCSFLLVAGGWLCCFCTFLTTVRKSKCLFAVTNVIFL